MKVCGVGGATQVVVLSWYYSGVVWCGVVLLRGAYRSGGVVLSNTQV